VLSILYFSDERIYRRLTGYLVILAVWLCAATIFLCISAIDTTYRLFIGDFNAIGPCVFVLHTLFYK